MTRKINIVGIGMNVLDMLIRLPHMPTWENTGNPSSILIDGGGLVATALVTAQKFGLSTAFIGTSGNDQMGEIKHQLLAKYDVNLDHTIIMPYPENQICVVYINEKSGERHFSVRENFWGHFLSPDQLDRDFITQADYLHMDGYHTEAAMQAARWMHEAGKQVMFDAGKTNEKQIGDANFRLVQQTDILISGSGYLQALTGINDVFEAGRKALELGPRIVVQTEGSDGSYTITAGEQFHTPAYSIEAVDTTGAGDVYHGAYLFGLWQGWNVRRIAKFATASSALECLQMGGRAAIPALDEVYQFLNEFA